MKGIWFTELQTKGLTIGCEVKKVLHREKTPFQEIEVFDTDIWGRVLVLDNAIQTTTKDEFVYHEMITHVALNTHPNPQKVLVIGGGDGGAIREIIKHETVEKATHVEIDKGVIEAAKKYLPEIAVALLEANPKVEVLIEDGIKHIKEKENYYDVIIVDSTDPVGPAIELFSKSFYANVYKVLKDDGMLVVQSDSPYYHPDVVKMAFNGIKEIFPLTRLYLANIPTYPSGLWSFTVGSKKYDPQEPCHSHQEGCRYYSLELHKAAFQLPVLVEQLIGNGE